MGERGRVGSKGGWESEKGETKSKREKEERERDGGDNRSVQRYSTLRDRPRLSTRA